ncbi:MAG: hypothetical protein RI911_440 [Candidatus Parcubacteria bacterium]|jgi:glutathione synthase/RimK-type ligase-like ATP-grasp enzyme
MEGGDDNAINRFFVAVVAAWATAMGGTCTRHFGDWILELTIEGVTKHVVWYDLGLNSATHYQTMKDKAATSWILERRGIACVEHFLLLRPDSQGWQSDQDAQLDAFVARVGFPLVVKPNGGSNGTGVIKVTSPEELTAALAEQFLAHRAISLSPFVMIKKEYRATVLDGQVELIYAKVQDTTKDFRFNLSHGAEVHEVSDEEKAQVSPLAVRALEAIGARFANIDIILDAAGTLRVLEVNGGVAFEKYSQLSADHARRAHAVYTRALHTLFGIPETNS